VFVPDKALLYIFTASLSINLAINGIPIEHVILGTLLQQQVTKEVAQVAIVWFVIEGKGMGVFKEGLKLGWKPISQGRCRGFLFALGDKVTPLTQALP
jgi:hypothetical protein